MSDLDTDRFIVEIEVRPAICDSEISLYSNQIDKWKAWDEVYEAMYTDYENKDVVIFLSDNYVYLNVTLSVPRELLAVFK